MAIATLAIATVSLGGTISLCSWDGEQYDNSSGSDQGSECVSFMGYKKLVISKLKTRTYFWLHYHSNFKLCPPFSIFKKCYILRLNSLQSFAKFLLPRHYFLGKFIAKGKKKKKTVLQTLFWLKLWNLHLWVWNLTKIKTLEGKKSVLQTLFWLKLWNLHLWVWNLTKIKRSCQMTL